MSFAPGNRDEYHHPEETASTRVNESSSAGASASPSKNPATPIKRSYTTRRAPSDPARRALRPVASTTKFERYVSISSNLLTVSLKRASFSLEHATRRRPECQHAPASVAACI